MTGVDEQEVQYDIQTPASIQIRFGIEFMAASLADATVVMAVRVHNGEDTPGCSTKNEILISTMTSASCTAASLRRALNWQPQRRSAPPLPLGYFKRPRCVSISCPVLRG
jgi:hypothetical protein